MHAGVPPAPAQWPQIRKAHRDEGTGRRCDGLGTEVVRNRLRLRSSGYSVLVIWAWRGSFGGRRSYGRRRSPYQSSPASRSQASRPDSTPSRLPAEVDEAAALERARRRSIDLAGIAEHHFTPTSGSLALLLGYGRLTGPTIKAGVKELAIALLSRRRHVDDRLATEGTAPMPTHSDSRRTARPARAGSAARNREHLGA